MNILKWLKSKSGKLPVTLVQAAGITAVLGAAGFGALSFLSSPADNNNAFLPPSVNQGQVVYIAQGGGGGQYEANGEVGSAFQAAPSRAIRLANQEAARQAQTRALEESAGQQTYQQPGDEVNPQMPKAYQVSNADLGLGMGTNADKQLNGSLEMFSNIQNQLSGVNNAVAQAQAQSRSGQAAGAAAPGNTTGQTAAQLASAPRNWGSNGLTRAGGGSGFSNSFVVQNSGKNADDKAAATAVSQAGNAIAQAQAAMAQMQEGTRMRSRANFGSSEGFGKDKDSATQRARRFNSKGKDELTFIRKQTAAINANKTNAANEGGSPFLASAKISGGLTVSGDNVTTGTGSSGDLRSTSDTQLRGVKGHLGNIESQLEKRTRDRHNLRKWMWIALPLTLASIVPIALFVTLAKGSFWTKFLWLGLAAALSAVVLTCIGKLLGAANAYANSYGATLGSSGGDFFSEFAKYLSYALMGGVAAAWIARTAVQNFVSSAPMLIGGIAAAVGFGGPAVYSWLSHKGEGPQYDDNRTKGDLDERAEKLKTGGGQNK